MVQKVSSPQTHGGQVGNKHKFLLGPISSKRDSAECASLLSENAEARTTRLANDISKVPPCSVR